MIADAAFVTKSQRFIFRRLAERLGIPLVIVHCRAGNGDVKLVRIEWIVVCHLMLKNIEARIGRILVFRHAVLYPLSER